MDRQGFESRGAKGFGPIKRGLKQCEILRSREEFKFIALNGKRIEGVLLRCKYVVSHEGNAQIRIGFKVFSDSKKGASSKLNAVRRNRIRRLMREAFSRELSTLYSQQTSLPRPVGIIVFYKGAKDVVVERISLAQIQVDMRLFCHAIASSAQVTA